jgi:hypothetical protein
MIKMDRFFFNQTSGKGIKSNYTVLVYYTPTNQTDTLIDDTRIIIADFCQSYIKKTE